MKPLRLLMVEDSEDDALLVARELRRGGYAPEVERVETEGGLREALSRERWDVVVSDHSLPAFSAPAALRVMREMERLEETPFIIVSGTMPDESAVDALRAGAGDFVSKQKLSRLVPAIERELRDVDLRRERRAALEALRDAVRARDEFLSIASHELKTPLTSLRLQVEILLRQLAGTPTGDPRLETRLATIDRSTGRLAELVNRLLDVSRLSVGGFRLGRERVDLGRLVVDAAARLRERAERAGALFRLSTTAVEGSWDRLRIDSVVTNLLENALKYGAGAPIDVAVRDGDAEAVLVVRDHGIGISPDDQARIFQRFERAVRGPQYDGLGIGLWLARRLVEAHGGTIAVDSRPGEGATFTVRLPKTEAEAGRRTPPGDLADLDPDVDGADPN